jgi:hypothetical protein
MLSCMDDVITVFLLLLLNLKFEKKEEESNFEKRKSHVFMMYDVTHTNNYIISLNKQKNVTKNSISCHMCDYVQL